MCIGWPLSGCYFCVLLTLLVCMEYMIDDRVIYRVEDNTLVNRDEPEQKITLTLTASRILLLLLRHQGEVLTRETLYKHVWEDYGLDASGNTLTQYISVLRRSLHTLEVNRDAILTVPRIGFMLHDDLSVVCLPGNPDAVLPETLEGDTHLHSPAEQVPEPDRTPAVRGHRHPWLLIGLTGPAVLILLYLNALLLKDDTYPLALVPVGEYQGCQVFTLPMYDHDRNQPSSPVMQAVIRTSGFSCLPSDRLYLHIDGNVAHGDKGKIWVAACELRTEDNTMQCRDYFSNDWRMRP